MLQEQSVARFDAPVSQGSKSADDLAFGREPTSDAVERQPAPMQRMPFKAYLAHGLRGRARWTENKVTVLQAVWSADRPIGAYEIADRLAIDGVPMHPAVVYRCLHTLVDARLVVSVISWKRYVISPDPSVACWGLLLCKSCRSHLAVDLAAQQARLDLRLAERGFAPRHHSAEVEGTCGRCQDR